MTMEQKWIQAVAEAELPCVECGAGSRATAFWKDQAVCSRHFALASLVYKSEGYTGSDIPDVQQLLHRANWVNWLWVAEIVALCIAVLSFIWWKLTH